MPRRVTLPGADELFRTTGGAALQAPAPRQHAGGEDKAAAQGDTRLRPVPDNEEGRDGAAESRPGAAPRGDGGEHAGREAVSARRQLTGERSGVPSAAAPPPIVTATVTPQVPQVGPAGPTAADRERSVPPPVTATPLIAANGLPRNSQG